MRTIKLPRDTRYFACRGSLLAKTVYFLAAGTELDVGDPESKAWNHGDYAAVPFTMDGETFYFLLSEMGLPELVQ